MMSAAPRWRRLLMWALRISSPSKACVVAYHRKPLLDRRFIVDDRGDVVGIERGSPVRFEDGLLSFREAWTGKRE